MSRLDDELKIALRRQEPSPDFTARLIERINSSPAPAPGFRQRFAAFFHSLRFGWAAIGATAVILIAIGVGIHQMTVRERGRIAAVNSADTGVELSDGWSGKAPKAAAANQLTSNQLAAIQPGSKLHEPRRIRANAVAVRREARPSPEAEAAKVQVLFALQVAGATLNDVQKAIHYDGPNDKPEPLNNR
ncbi:MAG: hypothetical protein WBV94_32370 [Blastocatellia bacterium]